MYSKVDTSIAKFQPEKRAWLLIANKTKRAYPSRENESKPKDTANLETRIAATASPWRASRPISLLPRVGSVGEERKILGCAPTMSQVLIPLSVTYPLGPLHLSKVHVSMPNISSEEGY